MSQRKDLSSSEQIIAEARERRAERETGYREQALKLFPWVCAHCGREFSGKRLKELTVHHRDHNHDNNPADGSNWELLCLYCHDNEHARYKVAEGSAGPSAGEEQKPSTTYKPFAALEQLLQQKGQEKGKK